VKAILVVSFASLASLASLAACKGKPERREAPNTVKRTIETPSKTGTRRIVLPDTAGKPPKPTAQPLSRDQLEALAALRFEGFSSEVRDLGALGTEIRHRTDDRPKLWVSATIGACGNACTPMELPQWKEREPELRGFLAGLRDAPDVDFEIGATELNGQTVIYTFQLGAGSKDDGPSGATLVFTNAYFAYFNDGVNQVRVIAEYKDDPKSKENLAILAPREALEALALAFLDTYTQAW
jgi:hypothetical protein